MNAFKFLKKLLSENPSPKNFYIQLAKNGDRYKLVKLNEADDRLEFLDEYKLRKGLSSHSRFQIVNVVSERASMGRINVIATVRSVS